MISDTQQDHLISSAADVTVDSCGQAQNRVDARSYFRATEASGERCLAMHAPLLTSLPLISNGQLYHIMIPTAWLHTHT